MAKIIIDYDPSNPPACKYNGTCYTLLGNNVEIDTTGATDLRGTGNYTTYASLQECQAAPAGPVYSPSPDAVFPPIAEASPLPSPAPTMYCYVACT